MNPGCWLLSSEWSGSSHGLKLAENEASSELLSIKIGVKGHPGVEGCTGILDTEESSSGRSPSAHTVTFNLLDGNDGGAGSTLDRFENGAAQLNNVNWRLAIVRVLT